jgi:hypothetical protein
VIVLFSSSVWIILLLGIAGLGGFCGGSWYRKKMHESELASAEELSGKILENAKKEAETIKKERTAWNIVHQYGGKVMVSSHPLKRLLYALDFMVMPGMPTGSKVTEAKKVS